MKVFIVHVKSAYEREKHMLDLLNNCCCLKDYEFVLEGDIEDLTEGVVEKYFESGNTLLPGQLSCAYKHILICEKIVEESIPYALVLEDDISFYSQFCEKLNAVIHEISQRKLCNYWVSLDDSNLNYVKGSERERDKKLYLKEKCRFTGAYLLDIKAAENILKKLKEKTSLPIDLFFDKCSAEDVIDIFWAHPVLASQASISGDMRTLIGAKRYGLKRALSYKFQRFYKRILFSLR